MDRMPQSLRYLLAILIGPIIGELAGVPLAQLLQSVPGSIGIPVAGAHWSLAVAVAILPVGKGIVTGCTAGWIAGRRGKWVGGLAASAPFLLVVVVNFANHRQLLDPGTGMAFLAGLLPAILCGHLTTEFLTGGASAPLRALASLLMLAFYPCGLAFHVYTIGVAIDHSGLKSGFATAVAPVFSEIFWFVRTLTEAGTFFNLYTILMLGVLALPVAAMILYGISRLIMWVARWRGKYDAPGATAPLSEARG